jgi:hypothetical protein
MPKAVVGTVALFMSRPPTPRPSYEPLMIPSPSTIRQEWCLPPSSETSPSAFQMERHRHDTTHQRISTVKFSSLILASEILQAWSSPRRSPTMHLKFLGRCETLRDNETHRRGSQRYRAIEARTHRRKCRVIDKSLTDASCGCNVLFKLQNSYS